MFAITYISNFLFLAKAQVQGCVEDLCETGLPAVNAGNDQLTKILQIVFGIVGAVAVIYIIIAGFGLITSLGNPEALAKARQALIFAGVGLAIALSAELIVTFVINRI
ncbi:MAG: hypothetical protein NTX11_01110 [Candidatus Saccharibacteria bacterium]|nr:hypothetical protein [Candidatus Saccharibacteria bacterium]